MNKERQNTGTHKPEGFKDTPIGKLPADWEVARLDEIAVPLTETAGQNKYETVSISAGVGFVNQAEKFGKELSGKQYEKYIVLHKGDFSYNKGNSNRYPQGCIYRLNDRESAAVPNVFESFRIVKGCPEYYEQLFVSGFLNHQLYKKINHGVRDDGLLNLTSKDFYGCYVPVPSTLEQEKIAKILSCYDKLIDNNQQLIENYKLLKNHFINTLFPSQGSAVPEVRFPSFSDSWTQQTFGQVYSERNEPGNSTLQTLSVSIRSGVSNGELDSEALGKVVLRSKDKTTYKHVYPGDLVFNMMRVWQGAIGVAKLEGMVSPAYISAIPKGCLYPPFMNYLSKQEAIIYQINSLSYGVTDFRKRLYWDSFAKIQCTIPSFSEQQRITELLEELDNLTDLYHRKLRELKTQKQAIMHLLLSGIVRVSP